MAKKRSSIPVYKGKFGAEQAERLLWRAGFGPKPGEINRYKKLGMKRAVEKLVDHRGGTKLVGPGPKLDDALAPRDIWGHDHIWWLDRMVRTNNPLQERMTLIWHDWFATSNDGVGSQRLMIQQNEMLRRNSLGSFQKMLISVTKDPAMLIWLSGNQNTKDAPNENYGRELMELFTLGAEAKYSENDVREQARALTGFRNDWTEGVGANNFRFDPKEHDDGRKKIFGKSGNFDWKDSCNLCLKHGDHAEFFVTKLWSYFIPVPLKGKNLQSFKKLYVSSGYRIKPVVKAILMHPAFYNGPRMVKPPIVFTAGLMRTRGVGIDTDAWAWISEGTGQRLFFPPNVSGWDDTMWLDTGTFRGRWNCVTQATREDLLDPGKKELVDNWPIAETPEEAYEKVFNYWCKPTVTGPSRGVLLEFAKLAGQQADSAKWKKQSFRVMRQNALRTLFAMSPDHQTC